MTFFLSAVLPLAFILLILEVSAQTLRPNAFPLAVRSPYLNAWVKFGTNSSPSRTWPTYYTQGGQNLGWAGIVQVDNVNSTFSFMGIGASTPATLRSGQITATQTILTYTAGPIRLIVNYLSPIEPDDWVKMSLPFAYMSVTAESTDGLSHEVRLYADISGEWCSNSDSVVSWDTVQTSKSLYHKIERNAPSFLSEDAGMGEDGVTYHAMRLSNNMSWRTGSDANSRHQFVENGRLANTIDTNFRRLRSAFPVVALSVDLGPVRALTEPVVWAVGKTRDPSIQFRGESGLQQRSSYFRATYEDISVAINDFLEDFPNAKRRADELDQKIQADAEAVSSEYAQLVTLAARQTFAATELTIAKGSDGAWNLSDVKMFMREMGSGRTASPVELIYAAYPAFLYFNSSLAGRLLEPLLEFQSTPDYNNEFAAPNLGTSYPNATGNTIVHPQGVEHSGNMIIMALAHAKYSGDGSLIAKYYPLLKRWAGYLVKNAFSPIGQTSADGLSNGNMTNLAIKGIIGIQAMSEISAAVNEVADSRTFSENAATLYKNWAVAASRGDRLSSVYGDSTSTGLMYNVFADKLLRTALVDQSIMEAQTEFYRTSMTNNPSTFGPPVDSDASLSGTVKSHWVLMAAAATTNSAVRDMLVNSVHARAGSPDYLEAFPSTYSASNGEMQDGVASGAQGAMFAALVLNLQAQKISTDASAQETDGGTNVGAIAGGVAGGVVVIAIFIGLFFLLERRRRQNQAIEERKLAPTPFNTQPTQSYNQPYTDDYHHSVAPLSQNSGHVVYAGAQPGSNQYGHGDSPAGTVNQYGYGEAQYGAGSSQNGNSSHYGYAAEPQPGSNHYTHTDAHIANQQYAAYAVPDHRNTSSSPSGGRPTTQYSSSTDYPAVSQQGSNNADDFNGIGLHMASPQSVVSPSNDSQPHSRNTQPTQPTAVTSLASVGRRSSNSQGCMRTGYVPAAGTYCSPSPPTSEVPSSRLDGGLQGEVAAQLRSEVETLRQQVSTLRQEREYDVPPPEYVPR